MSNKSVAFLRRVAGLLAATGKVPVKAGPVALSALAQHRDLLRPFLEEGGRAHDLDLNARVDRVDHACGGLIITARRQGWMASLFVAAADFQDIDAVIARIRDWAATAASEFDRVIAKRRLAEERGLALLLEHLSPAQRASWESEGYFEVRGGDTGRTYQIEKGHSGNVHVLDSFGRRVRGYCFYPVSSEGYHGLVYHGLVWGDVVLGQKIALEVDERATLDLAVQTYG